MQNLVKRVSLGSLMFMMVFVLNFGFAPIAHGLVTGDLVKGPNTDAVYYINGTMKHVFPDVKTYWTWYSNFDMVKTVTVAELDMFTTGAPVPYRPGTKLVTHPNTARVYAVEPSGTLRWVTDEATALALYGPMWAKWVNDVHELTFGQYTIGTDMTSTMHAKGTLLQKTGDATIYYFDGTNIRPFGSSAAFDANNFDYDYVVQVSSTSNYTAGSSITSGESFANIAGSGTGSGTTTTPAGTLSIALSPNTPVAGVLVAQNAARVPFTILRFTTGANPVTIDQMVVQRGGVAQDAAFAGVDILDGSTMLPFDPSSKTFNSDHQATFNKDVTIAANTTKEIILSGNMISSLANYAGEYPALGLASITLTGGSTVAGTLPIYGNVGTLNGTISIGSATVQRGSYTNATSTNLEVGKTNYTFFSFQIQGGSVEDVEFGQAVIYQNGSASLGNDMGNIKLYRDGTEIATGVADDKYIKFNFTPITIPKGQTFQFQVKADVIGGSARTIQLAFYRNTDLIVKGKTYGFNITPTYGSTGSSGSNPRLTDNQFTLGNGTLTVERSTTVGATNIAIGNDQTIGAFKFTVKGESIDVTALTLTIVSSTTGTIIEDALRSVKLVDSAGKSWAGPTDVTDNALTVALTDTFTLPIGETHLKVIGNMATNGGWATNDTILARLATPASAITAQGVTTGNAITATPTSNTDTSTQTVKAAKVVVSKNTTPASGNVVAGKQDLVLGSWSFDASDSGEDVRVTAIAFAASSTQVANLTVKVDGTAQTPVNDAPSSDDDGATSTFSLDSPIIITKGTKKTITLEGDVNSNATTNNSAQWGLTSSAGVTAYGVATGNSATVTVTADDGATLTYSATGTLTVTVSGNPSPGLVRAGALGVTFGGVRFDAVNESLDLDNLRAFLADGNITGTAAGTYQDSTKLYIYDGSTLVGSVSIPSTGNYQWTFANGTLTVPANGSKTLTFKSDMSTINANNDNDPGTPAADIRFGFGGKAGFTFTGNDSNSTVAAGSETYNGSTSTAFVLHTGLPTVTFSQGGAALGAATALVNGSVDAYKFKVAADSSGTSVLLYRVSFEIATPGGDATEKVTNCFVKDEDGVTIGAVTTPTNFAGENKASHVTYTFDNPDFAMGNAKEAIEIPAGATDRLYTLNCTFTAFDTGDYVSISLLGDTASSTPAASHGNPTSSNENRADAWSVHNQGNFVWSDNYKNRGLSADGANATSWGQWYNGYLVAGLGQLTTSSAYTISIN